MVAAAKYLKARPDCTGKIGVVGFCWGGSMSHTLATRLPDLNAAVPFYGGAPNPAEAAKVKAPLLVQLAENDPRVNAAWPPYEEALKAAGATYEAHVSWNRPRVQQRHDAALRREGGEAGVGAHGRVLQQAFTLGAKGFSTARGLPDRWRRYRS
jgi:dienelactone hydrolase